MDSLDEIRWAAVEGRSATADGVFFYAVATTGIFCRPVCSARRPRRENVEFFATPAEAVAAGYRACRRCHPDRTQVTDPTIASVIAVCRWLEHPDDDADVAELASRVGWSQRHLRRMFTDVTGVTIAAYARAQRAERVRTALRAGTPVTEAVFEAGYGSVRGFYEHGAPRLGSAPSSYRQGSPNLTISYTIVGTVLGRVLIAVTQKGVCAIRIGESDAELLVELSAEFSEADLVRADEALADIGSLIVELAAGRQVSTRDIPLDLRGTAFQVEVWEALRTIRPGEPASYGEVARRIGRPTATRAVAGACAANPVALVVPCHRVVRSDGSSGGYRWGPDRKAALLAAEAHSAEPTTP